MRDEQLLDSCPIVLIVQHGADVRALHDSGEEELHIEKSVCIGGCGGAKLNTRVAYHKLPPYNYSRRLSLS